MPLKKLTYLKYTGSWIATIAVATAITLTLARANVFDSASLKIEGERVALKNVLSLKTTAIKPATVNATLVMALPEQKEKRSSIRLAERAVYLKNSETNAVVDETLTQLDGKLKLTAPSAGRYAVCWKLEHVGSGCSRPFAVEESKPLYLGNIAVHSKLPYAYGDSLMQEGQPCWLHDPFFEVDLSTQVELLTSSGELAAQPVKANVAGEYVIGLPEGDRYRLRSTCEKTVYETDHYLAAMTQRVDLPLDNHVPKQEELAAFLQGQGVTRAPADEVLHTRLLARDKDNDLLEFTWKVQDGSGSVSGSNGETEKWMLPETPGMHPVFVMVRDGRGGYILDTLTIQVGVPSLDFSGIVIDEVTRQPIANARVDVGMAGGSTTTDANGWFNLTAAELTGEQRYPLNINHSDYATYSRVLHNASRGNTFEMIRAQVTQHDPSLPIDVVDTSSSGPCGIGGGKSGDGRYDKDAGEELSAADELQQFKQRDSNSTETKKDCRRRGARLQVPAGSLVYGDQTAAQGPISLSMATLNPARRSLPGDYRAVDAASTAVELVSFGALFAEFRDVNGKKINLKKGAKAKLTVPVSDNQASLAEPTIPMWSYDEKSGLWIEEDQGKLINTPSGPAYAGNTTHFSTINMDVAGSDPAFATCVRVEVDSSLDSWSNLVLRAYVPVGGDAVQVKETALDSDQYHAIYRIPYANPPAGNTLRLELRGELPNGEQAVVSPPPIQTDLRPKMTGTNLWPPYPYSECGVPIVLQADAEDLPYYGDIDATGRPAFLTGPYGAFLPVNGAETSANYYAAVDPTSSKTVLGDWWAENGFNADGSGGTRASYMNHNDLGFGRDMRCLGSSSDYACYVTNYGLPDQNPANADDAESQNPATQGATVTMEYHQSDGSAAVSFYAFNGGTAVAPRINFADLDGLGPKPIPHLCLTCHGGSFQADATVHDAVFREFDLPSLRYSADRSWDFDLGAAVLTPAEFSAFHVLNTEVADINPGNNVEELVDAWYSGGGVVPDQLSDAQVPVGWSGNEDVYRDVYANACRTCHLARPGLFDTFASFQFSDYAVCEQPKIMPNAFITYKNFWSNPDLVSAFEAATGTPNCFD